MIRSNIYSRNFVITVTDIQALKQEGIHSAIVVCIVGGMRVNISINK